MVSRLTVTLPKWRASLSLDHAIYSWAYSSNITVPQFMLVSRNPNPTEIHLACRPGCDYLCPACIPLRLDAIEPSARCGIWNTIPLEGPIHIWSLFAVKLIKIGLIYFCYQDTVLFIGYSTGKPRFRQPSEYIQSVRYQVTGPTKHPEFPEILSLSE